MRPFPDISSFRNWDLRLLRIYRPLLSPPLRACTLCALGPCGFKGGDRGRCGIDRDGFLTRSLLLQVLIGLSGHASLARRLFTDLTSRHGRECPVEMGAEGIKTPLSTLITGITPRTIGDMDGILRYIEEGISHLLSSVHYGGEGASEDFISKALHAGMLDILALEVGDVIQISALDLPKGEGGAPFVDLGRKGDLPFLLIVGHNSHVGVEAIRIRRERGLEGRVEIGGLCCAGHDISRHDHSVRIIGNQADQVRVVASGIADVVVLDTQCIRADIVEIANRVESLVIATAQETALGLKDLTHLPVEEILKVLPSEGACIILNKEKAAEVALLLALSSKGRRKGLDRKGVIRAGRGPVRESEIRGIAPSIVMGEIPGMVGLFGCPEEDPADIQRLAYELLSMGFIVATGGCCAIDIGKDRSVFPRYGDTFDRGNLINLGSCISASHFLGACVKIASVVSHRPIDGDFEGIADYILNRVGALLILWGGFTQKALATTFGAIRLGIPVLLGPRGRGYGIRFEGKEKSTVMDVRLGETLEVTTHPKDMLSLVDTVEEALYMVPRLTMRHNDTCQGRKRKLYLYMDLYRDLRGGLPDDIAGLVRSEYDLPEGMTCGSDTLLAGLKPTWIPDPTILKEAEDHGGP